MATISITATGRQRLVFTCSSEGIGLHIRKLRGNLNLVEESVDIYFPRAKRKELAAQLLEAARILLQ